MVAVLVSVIFLAHYFPFTSFKLCNKEVNNVTHDLARLATFTSTKEWFEEPLGQSVPFFIDNATIILK
mgnify:CR=1 FL=1